MIFHPTAQPGQNCKKIPEITFFPRKNDRFFTYTLPAHRVLPKCKHGHSASEYNKIKGSLNIFNMLHSRWNVMQWFFDAQD